MHHGSGWALAGAAAWLLAAGLPAAGAEKPICALAQEQDVRVIVEGSASAGARIDEEVQYNDRPALGVMGRWARGWDAVVLELKPVEFSGELEGVSLAFKGDTNLTGMIQFVVRDSKGKTLRAVLSKELNNPEWRMLHAGPSWQEPIWEGGDEKRRLDPPCALVELIITARQEAEALVHLADLRVKLFEARKAAAP